MQKCTKAILIILLVLPLSGSWYRFNHSYDDLENEKYLNFVAAIENHSTFSYFTVVKVKNLKTGVTKDICTKGNFLAGALHTELNAGYEEAGNQKVLKFAKSKRDRYFEFKSQKALENISFFTYNTELVNKIQAKYDFEEALDYIKKNEDFSIRLSDEEMKAYAHVLFNMGYLTGENNCFGGALEFVNRTKRHK